MARGMNEFPSLLVLNLGRRSLWLIRLLWLWMTVCRGWRSLSMMLRSLSIVLLSATVARDLPRETSRAHLKQMPEPRQLTPLDAKEQRLYSELLPSDPNSKRAPSHPGEESHFHHLYMRSYSFGHYPNFMLQWFWNVYVDDTNVSTFYSVNSISCSDGKSTKSDGSCSLASVDFNSFKATWIREVHQNKETWRSQAAKELEEDAQRCQHKNGIKEEKFIRKLLNVTDKILEMKSDRQKEKQENEGGARDPGSATNTYPQGGTELGDQEVDHPISGVEVAEVVKQLPGGGAPGADVILPGVLEKRIRLIVKPLIEEEQCGFRPGRGTTDKLFTLAGVLEGSWEFAQPVHMCFVDLEKAYDWVPRSILWGVPQEYGVEGPLIRAAQSLYQRSRSLVRIAG
ncbi:hypothetical protein D4764_17G0009490 [Takifugu flavidus]|uniref:Uncharacterized protein n=1 Tax=Takifugu flavidus TaxID=433684 RepID=A0A5C6NWS2_9TELE|nr:hypothetical protein D4764_17G0009490 [Takifugu flavidus]